MCLGDMAETVFDEIYLDIILKANTAALEFQSIRDMHYRDPFLGVERIKRTTMNYYIDKQVRKSSTSGVSGCGATMVVTSCTA